LENDNFLNNYLKPTKNGLDRTFTIPLPDIPGLEECSEFIVQGHQDNTYSTNIMFKYVNDEAGIRIVEVYKNSQDKIKGIFIRLVGTMAMMKNGYPCLFLDAAVSNVSPLTARQEDISTRVAIHMPQADPEERKTFLEDLSTQAKRAGIDFSQRKVDALPDFWGPIWSTRTEGIDYTRIKDLRDMTWAAYDAFCDRIKHKSDFNYRPMQEQMVFYNSTSEYQLFQRMGLSVPSEAQAAFFSILSFRN
jgi:hypothetical protein